MIKQIDFHFKDDKSMSIVQTQPNSIIKVEIEDNVVAIKENEKIQIVINFDTIKFFEYIRYEEQ